MPETYCVRHFDQIATGHCATCNKPYCADCLSLEADQPICANCKDVKAKAAIADALKASGNPMAGRSPLNFKGMGLDDDPLGLLGGGKSSPPKAEPTPAAPPVSIPSPAPAQTPPVPLTPSAPMPPKASPPMPFPAAKSAPSNLDQLGSIPNRLDPNSLPTPASVQPPPVPMTPQAPMAPKVVPPKASSPAGPAPLNLDELGMAPHSSGPSSLPAPAPIQVPPVPLNPNIISPPKPAPQTPSPMMNPPPPLKPAPDVSPSIPAPPSLAPASTPVPFPVETGDLKAPKKRIRVLPLAKIWVKFLIRHSYEMFDPLAKKMRIPTYAFLGLLAAVLIGAVIGINSLTNKPSVALVDIIQPIHMVQESSSQVNDMDITAYTDFQTQLQTMGFTPVIQMSIPQLPSPNFFDVGMKEDAGTYSEILKMPGQIAPHLSFVSVFSNGVWFSTNAWPGDNQTLRYLVSEFYPDDAPDQLYAQHLQTLKSLEDEKGWEVETMGENRYMAALSDHLRWFLNKKDLQAYQADFKLWH